VCGQAATPDAPPARSVKNVKLKFSPNGRYFVAKSWHVTDHPEKVFNEKNAYVFGKFLGERYKNNAILWFPGGDSAPGKYDAVWVAMAKGLKDGSDGSQLVCYHGQGSTSSSMWFHNADWLDFNSIQSGHNFGSDSYAFVSKDYALTRAKPTVDMEPAYENHPPGDNKPRVDAHTVRTQAYSAMIAGAAGHGYGALDLFWFYKDAAGPFPKTDPEKVPHRGSIRRHLPRLQAVCECNAIRLPSVSRITARNPYGPMGCFSLRTFPPPFRTARIASSSRPSTLR